MVLASGKVIPCRNEYGVSFPAEESCQHRTKRDAFSLSARDVILLYDSFDSEDPVRIVYHSHPDASAELSGSDLRAFAVGGLMEAGRVACLIIACRGGKECSAALHVQRVSGSILSRMLSDPRADHDDVAASEPMSAPAGVDRI